MSWTRAVLIVLDQLLNALLGGWPDETLSSRAWRWDAGGVRSWPRRAIDRVAACLGDDNHCLESFENERIRAQCPPELRP